MLILIYTSSIVQTRLHPELPIVYLPLCYMCTGTVSPLQCEHVIKKQKELTPYKVLP